jgi:hypothetical protein
MLRSRRMDSARTTPCTAATVRSRLLRDKTMRNHLDGAACLSPAEQLRQAVQITHGFKHHYLAEIAYLDACRMTVAVVRPVDTRRPAHEIWVDDIGNVSVRHQDLRSIQHRLVSRAVMIPGILLVALGMLFLAAFT